MQIALATLLAQRTHKKNMAKPWPTVIALLLALLVPARGFAAVMLTACIEQSKSSAIATAGESINAAQVAPCDDADCHNACEQLLSACLLPLALPSARLALLSASVHSFAAPLREHFFNATVKHPLRPPTFQR